MAIQTEYPDTMPAGREGAIYSMEHKVLISRNVEGAAVGFGKPLAQGDADRGARALTAGDTEVVGVTVRDRSTADDQFAVGESARVMTEGTIWVTAAVEVAAGDPVYAVLADSTFTNVVGTDNVRVTPTARYETSGAADALVVIRL